MTRDQWRTLPELTLYDLQFDCKHAVNKSMKRTPLARISKNPANIALRKKKAKAKKKVPYSWLKCIPEGSHGSGTIQKRLWKVTSDYVRIRDFYDWGYTIDGKKLTYWRESQAGHYREYSICNGMFKFALINIHAESPQSNNFKDSDVRDKIEAELERRYGVGYKERMRNTNKDSSVVFSEEDVIEQIKFVLSLMKNYPAKPDYYERATELLAQEVC